MNTFTQELNNVFHYIFRKSLGKCQPALSRGPSSFTTARANRTRNRAKRTRTVQCRRHSRSPRQAEPDQNLRLQHIVLLKANSNVPGAIGQTSMVWNTSRTTAKNVFSSRWMAVPVTLVIVQKRVVDTLDLQLTFVPSIPLTWCHLMK